MSSLVFVLIAVTIYCNEVHCDTFSTTIAKPEDTQGFTQRNTSHAIDKESFWKSLSPPQRRPIKLGDPKTLDATIDTNKRKSRLLGSLAFLAGLSFGGLATAASSSVRNIAKMPQASFALNLGSPKTSPYFAAYYNPYSSLLPYPLFYPAPLGFVPMNDHKPHTTSHNDLTPQVISLFENREPINFTEDNEEYTDEEKKFSKRVTNKNGADGYAELRGDADRNAEEKTMILGCKGSQRKHGSFFKGSDREREDLQVDVDDLRATLNFRAANMTIDANQTMTENTTMAMTTRYFGGHPQNVNHVDLTTGSDRYHNYDPINYNLPYEQPANFYHADKYNVYSSPHVNTHFSGPFSADQTHEYVGPNLDRLYHSEYQPPYAEGFRPVK